LVIGERAALAWFPSEQRMAFPPNREAEAMALQPDDVLLLYTTRGRFHNPTRDRGRVIGEARIASRVERLAEPVRFDSREYTTGCALTLERLVPLGTGVGLASLVPRLAAFPDPASWSVRMRGARAPRREGDLALIRKDLDRVARVHWRTAVATYVAAVPAR
jgi:hypothetical protein